MKSDHPLVMDALCRDAASVPGVAGLLGDYPVSAHWLTLSYRILSTHTANVPICGLHLATLKTSIIFTVRVIDLDKETI